jgi:hypothetical protein
LGLREATGLPDLAVFQTEQIRSIFLVIVFQRQNVSGMPEPFRPLDYFLCVVAFFLVGIAAVPLMTAWIR